MNRSELFQNFPEDKDILLAQKSSALLAIVVDNRSMLALEFLAESKRNVWRKNYGRQERKILGRYPSCNSFWIWLLNLFPYCLLEQLVGLLCIWYQNKMVLLKETWTNIPWYNKAIVSSLMTLQTNIFLLETKSHFKNNNSKMTKGWIDSGLKIAKNKMEHT